MRNKLRPIALILVLAILGFMLAAATSCTGLPPKTQAKLDQASSKYESATGITPLQTLGILSKAYAAYQAAKSANTPPPVAALPSK
jgi:hypothetical protein